MAKVLPVFSKIKTMRRNTDECAKEVRVLFENATAAAKAKQRNHTQQ
jgi:hypothetical protein